MHALSSNAGLSHDFSSHMHASWTEAPRKQSRMPSIIVGYAKETMQSKTLPESALARRSIITFLPCRPITTRLLPWRSITTRFLSKRSITTVLLLRRITKKSHARKVMPRELLKQIMPECSAKECIGVS